MHYEMVLTISDGLKEIKQFRVVASSVETNMVGSDATYCPVVLPLVSLRTSDIISSYGNRSSSMLLILQ